MLVERLPEGVRGNRRPPDQGQGERLSDVPVPGRLSQALASREWKGIQERFRNRRIVASGGIAFAASQFVFAGYSREPFSNRAFNLRLRAVQSDWGGRHHRARLAPQGGNDLLNHVGKDLREIQELPR
jgi:hypothetical protein